VNAITRSFWTKLHIWPCCFKSLWIFTAKNYAPTADIGPEGQFSCIFCFSDRSSKGPWSRFDHTLGDFRQNILLPINFTLEEYVKSNCLSTKPRIYLMSKPKPRMEVRYGSKICILIY
jgi:hypothetical protein